MIRKVIAAFKMGSDLSLEAAKVTKPQEIMLVSVVMRYRSQRGRPKH